MLREPRPITAPAPPARTDHGIGVERCDAGGRRICRYRGARSFSLGVGSLCGIILITALISFSAGSITAAHNAHGIEAAGERARRAVLEAIGVPDRAAWAPRSDHARKPLLVAVASHASAQPGTGFNRRLKGPRADVEIALRATNATTVPKTRRLETHEPSRSARALRSARLPRRAALTSDDPFAIAQAVGKASTAKWAAQSTQRAAAFNSKGPQVRATAAPGVAMPAAFTTFGPRVSASIALATPPPSQLALKTRSTGKSGDKKPFFGGLTETEFRIRETRCMTMAVYHEARGEPKRGQFAVGQIVMNRVRSSFFPDTVCGVIYQGAHRRGSCQFSFACDGISDRPGNKDAWVEAKKIAEEIIKGGNWLSDIGHATHYHATYVDPAWRTAMKRVRRIGSHIFYLADFNNWNKAIVSSLPVDRGRAN